MITQILSWVLTIAIGLCFVWLVDHNQRRRDRRMVAEMRHAIAELEMRLDKALCTIRREQRTKP